MKNVTDDECKEHSNESYKIIEDIVNVSESSLRMEIRHLGMQIKARIDSLDAKVSDLQSMKTDIQDIKDALLKKE